MRSIGSVVRTLLPELILPILFMIFGVYIFCVSFGYQFETRAYAHATGTVMVMLSFTVIVRDILRGRKRLQGGQAIRPASAEIDIRSLLTGLAWCISFLVLIMVAGFDVAVPAWVFALLLWHRVSRTATVLIPLLLWALVKYALEEGFDTVLFKGVLFGERLPRFW